MTPMIRTKKRTRPRKATIPGKVRPIGLTTNLLAATIEDARRRLPAFALILEGDALAPDFQDGDLLTVATDALPLPGDCVVASINGRYACLRLNADGDLSDNRGGFIPRGFYSVAGVVTDRVPRED